MGGVTLHYRDETLTVYQGDAATVLRELPAESVHMVCTSPPFWGLRDYGTATWEGGDAEHDHSFVSDAGATSQRVGRSYQQGHPHRDCSCGAIRQDNQLGLEPTPEEYVANLVGVFREVRRVLRSDGTVWLNLGDSYATGAGSVGDRPGGGAQGDVWSGAGHRGTRGGSAKQPQTGNAIGPMTQPNRMPIPGLKPKDLVGIPWRVAFALQADGWYLRSDIIWSKPNPMPESVTDRPTKSHEYLFLLAKSVRYYFDADAVRESGSATSHGGTPTDAGPKLQALRGDAGTLGVRAAKWHDDGDECTGSDCLNPSHSAGRNIRSVWTIATQPYPGAHFATFPQKLVEPCVKAGTSERGVCPECGAPWARVVERQEGLTPSRPKAAALAATGMSTNGTKGSTLSISSGSAGWQEVGPRHATTGWQPTCAHDAEPVPATVLDCFAGSGTTGLVSQALGRRAVLIDLSLDYLGQLMRRNAQKPLGLVG